MTGTAFSPVLPSFLRTLHLLNTVHIMTRSQAFADNPARHARSLKADQARLNADLTARFEAGTLADDLKVISALDRVTFGTNATVAS
jgi:hypothetical protein